MDRLIVTTDQEQLIEDAKERSFALRMKWSAEDEANGTVHLTSDQAYAAMVIEQNPDMAFTASFFQNLFGGDLVHWSRVLHRLRTKEILTVIEKSQDELDTRFYLIDLQDIRKQIQCHKDRHTEYLTEIYHILGYDPAKIPEFTLESRRKPLSEQ